MEELGRGGMGVVFRAWDEVVGRWAALKLLPTDLDPAALARFLREGQAMARVQHPGIVQVHASGQADGRAWIAMALVEGGPLSRRLLAPPPLTLEEKLGIVRDAARALDHAHRCGIVHRDVKPANLFLDRDGRPLVGDFGLARFVDGRTRLTRTSEAVGTPAYMAPEQIDGAAVDARADVYALGATLYFALTGQPPFRRDNHINLIQAVLVERPDPPSRHAAGIAPGLDAIVLRCLEKDPAARWPDAASLADALDGLLGAPSPVTLPPPGLAPRRVPGWAIAATFLVGAGSFAGLVVWERRPRAPLPEPAPAASVTPTPPPARSIRLEAVQVREWSAPTPLLSAAWRPGTEEFAVAGDDGLIHVGRLDRDAELVPRFRPEPPSKVYTLASSPDGRHLVSGADDGRLLMWEWSSGRVIAEHRAQAPAWHAAFSPDGRQLALSVHEAAAAVWLFDGTDLSGARSFLGDEVVRPHPGAVCWSSDGQRMVVTVNAHGGASSRLVLTDVRGEVRETPGVVGAIQAGVLPEPDDPRYGGWHFSGAGYVAGEDLIAVGTWDSPRLLLWDVARSRWDSFLEGTGRAGGPVLAARGDLAFLGQHSGDIVCWNVAARRRELTAHHATGAAVAGLVILQGDPVRLLSAGVDRRVVLWELRPRQEAR